MEYTQEIINKFSVPFFPSSISSKTHKIFLKYTSTVYRKYSLQLLDILCTKSPFTFKNSVFYLSVIYLDTMLFNCGNEVKINNLDLMILESFFIAVKSLENQFEMINIEILKNIHKEKFAEYKNDLILNTEIICLRLLNYNINIVTAYDFIFYILKDYKTNTVLMNNVKNELDKIIFGEIKFYIFKSSYALAVEIIDKVKEKFNIPLFIKIKKNIKNNKNNNNNNKSIVINTINNIKEKENQDYNSNYLQTSMKKKNLIINNYDNNNVPLTSRINTITLSQILSNKKHFFPNFKNYEQNSINKSLNKENSYCSIKNEKKKLNLKQQSFSNKNIINSSSNILKNRSITNLINFSHISSPINIKFQTNKINIDYKTLSEISKKIIVNKNILTQLTEKKIKQENNFYIKKKITF